MLGKVFKAYDVRATYPIPLNETTAWKIGYGAARFMLEKAEAAGERDPMMHHIIVGRDMRSSSPALTEALSNGIRCCGAHVIDVGLVDTPLIYFAVNHLDCAGGIMTTASHNPPEYNGFKISGRYATPIGQETGLDDISRFAAMADPDKIGGPDNMTGRMESRDLWEGYCEHILSFLELEGKSVKVVVDASNGMAGTMVPKVFADIPGLEIIKLNFDNISGVFSHQPNPLVPANLDELRARVIQEKADLGICFDGDADRGIFVDEKANIIGCDHLTAALSPHFLEIYPGSAVAYDLRSSRAVPEAIRAAGGVPIESRVGHVFMKQQLREHEGVFGGELSGHFYFRDNFYTDSGAIAFAAVLSLLAETGKSLGELIQPVARYAQSGEINFENEEKDEALEELAESFMDRADITDLDGITIDCFDDAGWWCNVRKSNTEPLLRLNLEAKDAATCERIIDQIAPMLGKKVNH